VLGRLRGRLALVHLLGRRRAALSRPFLAGFWHERCAGVRHHLPASLAGREGAADDLAVRRGLLWRAWTVPAGPEDERDPEGQGGREGDCHDAEPVVGHCAHLRQ